MRMILTVLLLVSSVQAQATTPIPDPNKDRHHREPILFNSEFLELRRGTEEGFLIRTQTDSSHAWDTYWGAPFPENGRFVPTQLEIKSDAGITVRSIRYQDVRKVSLELNKSDTLMGPYEVGFHFQVRASKDLAVGHHVISGKLKFQRVTASEKSEPEEIAFEIPLEVVDRHARTTHNANYPWEMKPADWVRVILLAPIMIPYTLLTWDGC